VQHTTSADGTRIAYETVGTGPPVVIVGGAFSTHTAGSALAAELAEAGFRGVTVDRRARGQSGDTPPYAPSREVEDLAAVVAAVGGNAAVLGHSSGAVLCLLAATEGVALRRLFLSEPPFRFGIEEPADDLADRLQTLVDGGMPEEAVMLFQREAVGLPEPVVQQIRSSPMFVDLVPLAQSVVYDARLVAAVSMPTPAMLEVSVPVTVLRGDPTFPFLVAAVDRLAAELPNAENVVVPESRDHGVDPGATARLIAGRLAS
jgi:pimeloyl-ACP methyl ester carboxylesterase